jgi:S1-C subfamily serine protease
VANQSPGTHVTVTIMRGASQMTVTLTLGQRPANA